MPRVADELRSLREDLTTVNSSVNDLNSKIDTLDSKMERQMQSSLDTNTQQINALNSKLDTLTATTARLSTEHQNLQTSISDVECTDSGEVVKLRSRNFPGRLLGVSQGVGRIIYDGPFTQWKLVSGLCWRQNTITFESVDKPGQYLRHKNYILHLEPYDGTELFRNDACFHPRHNQWFNGYTAFESVNVQNYYIRHYHYRLKISRNASSDRLLTVDSSFKIEAV